MVYAREAMQQPTEKWQGPFVVHAEGATTLERWAREHRSSIDRALLEYGAVLFRGFSVGSAAAFRKIAEALCTSLVEYLHRSTPRTSVADQVYTATEYTASATIPLHNEHSYCRDWPMRLIFCCLRPADTGGETTIALTRNVTRRIPPEIVRRFAATGVKYVRNYGLGVDLSWQTTFQTESRAEVETYCRKEGIDYEWFADGRLRTAHVAQALAAHPQAGDELWFNQAHLFHISSLGPKHRDASLELFGEENLPRNAYLGNGEALDEDMLAQIRKSYEAETLPFAWRADDVLLVDNMLVLHGRNPFTGPRQVLVAMGDASGFGSQAGGPHGRY
ncbi:MAG: TauD/TfdA family dioxygenase [Cyanobacteria bacterium]|nr:TauD/TfdA family dioxygenase [Cyanobacteriota bacterium]